MKKGFIRGVALLTMSCMLLGGAPLSHAETATEAWGWDAESGRLAVDYESFLSQHDLVYTSLPSNGDVEGMPVANGQTGAMVWQDDGLRMQIHSVDNAPHSAFSAAQVRLVTTPTLNGDQGFEQRLHLYDGYVSVAQNQGFTAEVFGVPDSETMALHVKDSRKDVSMVAFDVEMWTATDATINASATADPAAWKTVTPFEKDGVIGYTKGISAKEPFGYAFAVAVDGADYTVVPKDEKTARIYITLPESGEYTLWMNAFSRCHLEQENIVGAYETTTYASTAEDVIAASCKALEEAKKLGYEGALKASKDWWHSYWERSFVHYENTNAVESDYLENFYYLSQYQLGGAAYATYPQNFMRSVYNTQKDEDIRWNVGYWHFNQRAVYNGFLASNHVDGFLPMMDLYNGIRDAMTTFTVGEYNTTADPDHGFIDPAVTDAMKTPETVRWDGYGGVKGQIYNNDYVGLIFSTGPEVAENMYRAYRYTMDEELLERYYEYIRRTVRFITEWVRWDETAGNYQLEYSNALENWWKINNSTVDNAAIRALIPMFLDAAKVLEREEADAELIAKATDVLAKLEPITMTTTDDGKERYAAYDINDYTVTKTNRQSPELEVVYPHDLVGLDHEDLQIAINTFGERGKNTTKVDIWAVDGIQAARLGLGDDAETQMGTMITKTQKRNCGWTDDGNGRSEPMGLHISTMNEMLLQSYDGLIRVFPAVPSGNDFNGAFTLLANGGFLVSGEYAEGATRFVGIKSQYGGTATVKCPWDVAAVLVNGKETAVTDGKIVLETVQGENYLIQPVSDVEYETVAYTATANNMAKTAFGKTLGLASTRTGAVNVEYDFNDTITDNAFTDKRSGNTAPILGSGTTVVARGENDQAVQFNGSGYLKVPTSNTFDPMGDFSFSFDMNTTATGTMVLFDKFGNSQGFYLDLYQKKFRVMLGNKVWLNPDASSLLDGNWHTVQIDLDTENGTLTIYFDGVQKGQTAYTSTLPYVEQEFFIGCSRQVRYGYIGMLDNVKMVALGEEEATVAPQNDLYSVEFNESLTVPYYGVLTNDTEDPLGLEAAVSETVRHGTLQFFGDGAFIYTPAKDYMGFDSFTYEVFRNGEKVGSATVTLQVAITPKTENDLYQIYYGESLTANVTDNDRFGSGAPLQGGDYTVEFVATETQTECPVALSADGSFSYEAPALPTTAGAYYDPEVTFQYRIKTELDGVTVYSDPVAVTVRVTRQTSAMVYYDFDAAFTDGKITDVSGAGNHGVITGGVTRTEAGTALLDGTGWIKVPHSDSLDLRDGFEISMKIKTDKSRNQVLIDKSNIPGTHVTRGLYVDVYGGNIRVFTSGLLFSVASPFNAEEFTDFRLTYSTEEGAIKLYLNGELAGSAAISGTMAYVNSYASVGARLRDAGMCFSGELDDLRIRTYPLPEGDLSGDGILSTADVVLLMQHLVGYDVAFESNADLNGDGRVSIVDAIALMKLLNG